MADSAEGPAHGTGLQQQMTERLNTDGRRRL